MQEAYLVFLKCQAAYPVLDTPQHFMALYQTAYTRHFTNLAYKDTDGRCVQSENTVHAEGEDARVFESVGELDNDGALAVKLSRAPAEVRMVLQLLLNAPQELLDIALSGWTGKDKRCKAGGSKKICQMLGLPDEHDVLQQVHDYFTD